MLALIERKSWWGPNPEYGWPDLDFVFTGGQGCGDHSPPGVVRIQSFLVLLRLTSTVLYSISLLAIQKLSPLIVVSQRCPGQTNDEYISEFTIWAIASGQILIAVDPRNMTDFQRSVWFNKEVSGKAFYESCATAGGNFFGTACPYAFSTVACILIPRPLSL